MGEKHPGLHQRKKAVSGKERKGHREEKCIQEVFLKYWPVKNVFCLAC
jgi:hypothetical protein